MNIHQNELAQQLSDLLTRLQQEEGRKTASFPPAWVFVPAFASTIFVYLSSPSPHKDFPIRATEIYFFKHVIRSSLAVILTTVAYNNCKMAHCNVWGQEKNGWPKNWIQIGQFFGHHCATYGTLPLR